MFERGGRAIGSQFPEIGLPNNTGTLQKLDEPGRPDIRQSNRGPGTGSRIAVPVLNITKTRLNDPHMWFLGTNDQPGDYRSSGCTGCHVGLRERPRPEAHAVRTRAFGHGGRIADRRSDDPEGRSRAIRSSTRSRAPIPSSQCMVCHMHQPNVFVNTYYGYTMWDYESDAPFMWPEKQRYPTDAEAREILDRNPEEAAIRGKWSDPEFLKSVSSLNPKLKDTQFADYHGHGWNFRAVFKRDRKGTLLDKDGKPVADDDPAKFQKAVHLSSIHLDLGMHCVDCHFAQDTHGNGHLYGEVAAAIEIDCADCHGTATRYPTLFTSGPASRPGGTDLALLRTQDGRKRFEWRDGKLYQRSALDPDREWEMTLVKDTVEPEPSEVQREGGPREADGERRFDAVGSRRRSREARTRQRQDDVPVVPHVVDDELRRLPPADPGELEDRAPPLRGRRDAQLRDLQPAGRARRDVPARQARRREGRTRSRRCARARRSCCRRPTSTASGSTSSSRRSPRRGFSSQAFAPHYPHTERKTETKTCSDCHVSQPNDNNAIMAQLLLQGTNFVNFVGFNAWVGEERRVRPCRSPNGRSRRR